MTEVHADQGVEHPYVATRSATASGDGVTVRNKAQGFAALW
jgi:hypothetical protein